jgi:hypothetical protein
MAGKRAQIVTRELYSTKHNVKAINTAAAQITTVNVNPTSQRVNRVDPTAENTGWNLGNVTTRNSLKIF